METVQINNMHYSSTATADSTVTIADVLVPMHRVFVFLPVGAVTKQILPASTFRSRVKTLTHHTICGHQATQ